MKKVLFCKRKCYNGKTAEIMKKELNNLAFIDGQNLHLWTKENNWSIDYIRFSIYLRDKYNDKLGTEYYDNLEQDDIKRKIAYKRGH